MYVYAASVPLCVCMCAANHTQGVMQTELGATPRVLWNAPRVLQNAVRLVGEHPVLEGQHVCL